MAFSERKDQDKILDNKMAKLQQQLYSMERQMEEQKHMRRKVEKLHNNETSRTLQAIERANSKNMMLQEDIERYYNSPSPSSQKLLEEVMALRTKEFHKSQAKKAANIKHLAAERQKIVEARNRLREKNDTFRSLPSPIGKATHRIWGHKYSLYTPIYVDSPKSSYVPVFDKRGYYTYFPSRKQKLPRIGDNGIFVPVPIFRVPFIRSSFR